jgi:catechol 2,3-dioxygenase-like lactoylglutathione lyase family enzyme
MELSKGAVDLGIIIRDSDTSLAFYRDLLGMRFEATISMPIGTGVMHRLWCGDSLIKLVRFDAVPEASNPAGGFDGATGFRYLTIHVSNLHDMMAECEAAGVKVLIPTSEIRPGVSIGMVEDPDGNVIEFLTVVS